MQPGTDVEETGSDLPEAPDEFVEQVREALEHLYDFPYLQRAVAALAPGSLDLPGANGNLSGQWLRRELIAAIETLDPGPAVEFLAPPARLFNLLQLHFVEGLTVQQAAVELSISRRQAHRDLHRALQSVAAVLWARRAARESSGGGRSDSAGAAFEHELNLLGVRPVPVDLRDVLRGATEAVARMAVQHGVNLRLMPAAQPVLVFCDPMLARQVFVNTLSRVITEVEPESLVIQLGGGRCRVTMDGSEAPDRSLAGDLVRQLTDRLSWSVDQRVNPTSVELSIAFGGDRDSEPKLLVIDDNEGMAPLLEDYLVGYDCTVVSACEGDEGLRLARDLDVAVILLDVMMPGIDGWEFLQRLHSRPETAAIPVIVCSVVHNPELALSLGASVFLSKPLGRSDLLAALAQVGVL
ncbi:MAG: response regulator [Chloroflexi bacterium]|nr:response regulator [Chloroflexota bacterium]